MIDVCFTYSELESPHGKLAVIIDTLRATTTIITAIDNGASFVIPVESIEDALRQREIHWNAILGGERKGIKIEGFDIGNSPSEYSRDLVSHNAIIITTTNGTRAIKSAAGCNKIILAALINSKAAANYIKSIKEDIVIVCSGTAGKFTMEDAYTAGCIISKTGRKDLTDSAYAAKYLYDGLKRDPKILYNACYHLNKLIDMGFSEDVVYSLKEDTTETIPYYANDKIIRG